MFVVGALPAAMAVMVQRKVKEPELWLKAKAEGKITGGPFKALGDLFRHRVWRKNALLGLAIGCAGIVGFWGIGVFSNDLVGSVLKEYLKEKNLGSAELKGELTKWTSINMLMLNIGGFHRNDDLPQNGTRAGPQTPRLRLPSSWRFLPLSACSRA